MGLSNSSIGLYTGVVFFAIPQMLAARHVPEGRIAGISAAAMFPYFWSVVFGPMLDVRFSRRWYATLLAALEAVLVVVALLNLDHLAILETAVVLGSAASMLSGSALGGWLSTVCPREDENRLSAWYNIANISSTGVTSVIAGELVRHLPMGMAASLLGGLVFLPAVIFLFMPAPGPDRRLAGESFAQFSREVFALLRRREVLIALLLFVSPCGSFALTNMLGGLGNDFSASPRIVSLAGGAGAIVPGVLGSLLLPLLAKRAPLRLLYLANGVAGGLFTLSLIALPHTSWSFVLALIGEFLFQAVSYATATAITLEVIGQNNPLAATTFIFLIAATNVPITYMLLVDGRGYSLGGIAGGFAADAVASIAMCLLIGLLLTRLRGAAFGASVPIAEPLKVLSQEE
jgi:PAT family beta-lactamase induction signal transducer AmpG